MTTENQTIELVLYFIFRVFIFLKRNVPFGFRFIKQKRKPVRGLNKKMRSKGKKRLNKFLHHYVESSVRDINPGHCIGIYAAMNRTKHFKRYIIRKGPT